MSNGSDGQHEQLNTLMAALFALFSWIAKFTVNRYFDRKDRLARERQTRDELRQLLEEDKRKSEQSEKSVFDE